MRGRLWRLATLVGIVLVAGCEQPTATPTRATASTTPSPSGSVTSPSSLCPGLDPTHRLAIVRFNAFAPETYIRDVNQPDHGITVCQIDSAPDTFVSATVIGIENLGSISTLDLVTGQRSQVLTYVHNDGPVFTMHWSSRGDFAYGRCSTDGLTEVYHVIRGNVDRVVASVPLTRGCSVGDEHVEFSPAGAYLAIGSPAAASTGDGAAVQVRNADGSLAFAGGGSGQLTWSGERLYYDTGTGIASWDPQDGMHAVVSGSWLWPARSPDGRWIAYRPADRVSPIQLLSLPDGQQVTLPRGDSRPPVWVTANLLLFNQLKSCPTPMPANSEADPCTYRPMLYDVQNRTVSSSLLAAVLATWPAGTPTWW